MMMSVRVMARRMNQDANVYNPDSEDEGFEVLYDPDNRASVERAQAVLINVFGLEHAPTLFGGAPRVDIGRRLARLFRWARPGHTVAPAC